MLQEINEELLFSEMVAHPEKAREIKLPEGKSLLDYLPSNGPLPHEVSGG